MVDTIDVTSYAEERGRKWLTLIESFAYELDLQAMPKGFSVVLPKPAFLDVLVVVSKFATYRMECQIDRLSKEPERWIEVRGIRVSEAK